MPFLTVMFIHANPTEIKKGLPTKTKAKKNCNSGEGLKKAKNNLSQDGLRRKKAAAALVSLLTSKQPLFSTIDLFPGLSLSLDSRFARHRRSRRCRCCCCRRSRRRLRLF